MREKGRGNSQTELLMEIYKRLFNRYGDPHWWPGETPYEVIAGAVLTQNTAWSNVEKALVNFGSRLSPEYIMSLDQSSLAEIIRPAGFHNQKSGYLLTVTQWFEQYGYCAKTVRGMPMRRVRAELLSLKGVGRETADSILLYAFGFPSFVVDAYTMRLVKRLPLDAKDGYEPVKAFFEQNLPCNVKLFNEFHALIVLNGNAYCRKTPKCRNCPLFEVCTQGKTEISKMSAFATTKKSLNSKAFSSFS